MKRFLWAVLAAFLLTGCEIKQDEQMIPSNSFWPGWDSPLEQTLADGISSFSEKIYLPAECKDQLDIAFWHILCAKPEFFFLNGEYRYSLSEDTLIFSPSYTMTKSEALTYAEKLETISDGLLNGVSDALSTEDRALLLHDRLLHKLSYDQKHASPLLDALLAGCADCEGYARAYQYLLQKAGIPALYVTGEANGGGHAWIIMECEDGTWYHVDPTWDDGENTNNEKDPMDGYINFSKGKMKVDELEALLDTLEIEITFIDKNDINSYYNDIKADKIFKRAKTSLGREVYSCHPPQVEPIVRKLIDEFKKGSKDKFQIIKNIKGNDHAVTYYAVRDKNENYLGVLETVQDLSFYKSYLEIWDKAKKK